MKKYIASAAALLLIAGISNAQVAKKHPVKATTAPSAMVSKPAATSTSPKVSSSTSSTQVAATTPVKRKHSHKKSAASKAAGK